MNNSTNSQRLQRLDSEIWQLEVEFERFVRSTVTYRTYVRYARIIYSYISAFPEKTKLSHFYITDVEDFCVSLERDGKSKRHVEYVRSVIKRFYEWLRTEKGFSIPAIKSGPRVYIPLEPASLSLLDFERLFTAAKPIEKRIISLALKGASSKEISVVIGLAQQTVGAHFRRLRAQLGMPEIAINKLPRIYERMCLRIGQEAAEAYLGETVKGKVEDAQPIL